MEFDRLAAAKVNLFLHVGPLGADGYHPICSLMTFADVGDRVRFLRADAMAFEVAGPFGAGLVADADANLVVRARDAILAAFDRPWPPFQLTLDKRLPVAAGLGGGSSDAAATLQLLADVFDLRESSSGREIEATVWRGIENVSAEAIAAAGQRAADQIDAIARSLGSDVTACLAAVPVLARGRGDELDYPPVFPDVDAVLVNPRAPSSTARVYAALDEAGTDAQADEPDWPDPIETPQELARFLALTRNDLEGPAIGLEPKIGEVLAALRQRPETLFARMSGSGSTCFAVCASERDGRDLALAVADAHRDWWVQPCRLAGFCP